MLGLLSGSRLSSMCLSSDVRIEAIAAYLDCLGHAERWEACDSLGRKAQRALYQKAVASAPLTLDSLVPPVYEELHPVHHQGRNTLPLPSSHRRFEKRFARAMDESASLYGYNEAPSRPWIGPGYFVAYETRGYRDWQEHGGIVVDYYQVPTGQVPDGWPEVVPNSKGLQWFVYNGTRDFLRKVSEHVTIGAAYKGDKALDHYFVLCREV